MTCRKRCPASGYRDCCRAKSNEPPTRCSTVPSGYAAGSGNSQGSGEYGNSSEEPQFNLDNVESQVLNVLGKIWNLPNTVLGLTIGTFDGLIGVALGQIPQISFGQGAIQISNLPNILGPTGAITFGDVQLYTGTTQRGGIRNSGYTGLSGFSIGAHEGGHTIRSDILGPLFFPLYLGSALVYGWYSNPFETNADYHAANGTSALPW